MKFYIISKLDEVSVKLSNELRTNLMNGGAIEDEESPDIVVSIGGDGTMLRAVHKYIDSIENVKFVGLHTGTLGFFTNYTANDVGLLSDNLLHNVPSVDELEHFASIILTYIYKTKGLSQWLSGKESACQCRRHKFDPWVRKIPWRRKWQHSPVFLHGESHGQRSGAGYSPRSHKESDTTEGGAAAR